MFKKLSATEISELQQHLNLSCVPSTARGVSLKAEREEWAYERVPAKGGKDGKKNVFVLPEYVIDEVRGKGGLSLIKEDITKDSRLNKPNKITTGMSQQSMVDAISGYDNWAAQQDKTTILPVRYFSQVFASAGSGAIAWDVEPEAMWFRAAFFDHLGISPDRCFCTRIKGDSMFPTLIDRGTALWQAIDRYTTEGIYLFRQHEELRVKRLQRISSSLFHVISDNDNKSIYPTTELDLSRIDAHDFEILGRYLWDCGIAK